MSRTIADALDRFELIHGAGSEAHGQACAMTALAWVAGEAWTDRPQCANPLLATWVIQANDAPHTTVEQRRQLVEAGATGIIDTWWVPDRVLVDAWARSIGTRADRVVDVVRRVAAWKADPSHPRPVLRGAVLSGAVLSGAVLSGADLSGADLSGAVLRGADLRGAVLRGAVLSGAGLSGAVLRGAVLSGAVLRGADLRGADLRGADLRDADLRGAVLSGAVLRGADLSDAVLRDADLRGAYYPYGPVPSGWVRQDNRLVRDAS